MAKRIPALTQLTTVELKRLLAARERIDVLEAEKARLLKSLGAVDRELAQLLAGATAAKPRAARKPAKKAAKKAPKKAPKKAAKKGAKKTVRASAKKTAKKTAKKAPRRKAAARRTAKKPARRAAAGRVRLEDVIVAVLKKSGGTLPFKQLHDAIVKGKLFATKASNFDNVLRRTLSTSAAVKRVGRGVYAVA